MRGLALGVSMFVISACTPTWVGNCDCEPGQLCRSAFDADPPDDDMCITIPSACETMFVGDCSGAPSPDDACREAVCGEPVESYERQCFEDGSGAYYHLACTATL